MASPETKKKRPYYYRIGARYEYRTIAWLKRNGFQTLRSAGSHGPFDIVAWNDQEVRFISVKYESGLQQSEFDKLHGIQVPPSVRKLIYHWRKWKQVPDVYSV